MLLFVCFLFVVFRSDVRDWPRHPPAELARRTEGGKGQGTVGQQGLGLECRTLFSFLQCKLTRLAFVGVRTERAPEGSGDRRAAGRGAG
jgi:hypothetical protein